MKCDECGSEMEEIDGPEYWFSIPFTKLEVWRWVKNLYCLHCENEKYRQEYDDVYGLAAALRFRGGRIPPLDCF